MKRSPIRESSIERYFCRRVRALGGLPLKFVSPGRRNVPDRLVLWDRGWCEFVELKRPGEKPRAGQLREHRRLRSRGFDVPVIDSRAAVDRYIEVRKPQ